MKIPLSILLLFLSMTLLSQVSDQPPSRRVKNQAFKKGEKLEFRVYYNALLTGNVTAGYATVEVMDENKFINGRPVFHVVGEGKSRKAFDWFFKVRDRMESFFDTATLLPYYFIRRTREANYSKDDDVKFDHKMEYASSRNALKKIPADVQDIVSAVYFARNIDFSDAKMGQAFSLPFFLDDSVYTSVIQFFGREIVKTSLGEFRCLKFRPMVATGKVFSNPYPMTLWVTDDGNRLPLLIQSAVVIGTVKIELTSFANIANVLTSKVIKAKE